MIGATAFIERGLEIAGAANKLARQMGIESFKRGWLWRFINCHGIGNEVKRGESSSADVSAIEPFRLKFIRLMKKENLYLGLTMLIPLCFGGHYQEI